jgi:GntR family transcriptional regulator
VIIVVDPQSPELAYLQVARLLEARIKSGELSGKMPAERALAEEYEVSYGTVRRAISVLRDSGLVRSVHGRGTFVAEPG